ncbi:hypothetical protein AVM02_04855 [Brucella anthropi]
MFADVLELALRTFMVQQYTLLPIGIIMENVTAMSAFSFPQQRNREICDWRQSLMIIGTLPRVNYEQCIAFDRMPLKKLRLSSE